MKTIIKVLEVILCFFLIIGGTIFGVNAYNDHKYGKPDSSKSADVTDLDQYPTDIDGVEVKVVDSGTFQGFHLIPDKKLYKGVIVCYGGSEGSPAFDIAEKYAKKGYETLAVFMFGMKNQQESLVKVPLEQFEDVLAYVGGIKDHEPVTIWAASKGSEYALNLAAKYDDISNLVLVAPSAYSFSGLDFQNQGSSWTWKNKDVSCIDIMKTPMSVTFKKMVFPMIAGAPVSYKDIYDAAIDADSQKDKKLIPVEGINADILLIVGEDDQMWGSGEMAQIIQNHNKNVTICSYKDAGHSFSGNGVSNQPGMRMRLGGTKEGNKKAAEDSEKATDAFLESHHSK